MSDYLELNAGDDAILRCISSSSIRWVFTNGPLSQKFDYTRRESELIVKKVQNIDSGIYTCIIKEFHFAKLASINLLRYTELKVFGMKKMISPIHYIVILLFLLYSEIYYLHRDTKLKFFLLTLYITHSTIV